MKMIIIVVDTGRAPDLPPRMDLAQQQEAPLAEAFSCQILQELPSCRELPHLRSQLCETVHIQRLLKVGIQRPGPFAPLQDRQDQPFQTQMSAWMIIKLHQSSTSLSAQIPPLSLFATSIDPKRTHVKIFCTLTQVQYPNLQQLQNHWKMEVKSG